MSLVHLSEDTLLYSDPSSLRLSTKMRKCQPLLYVNVFREAERGTKEWGSIGRRMQLTSPIAITVSESY